MLPLTGCLCTLQCVRVSPFPVLGLHTHPPGGSKVTDPHSDLARAMADTYPAELTRVSPIWELAIHLVSSTVVRAWGSLPMSFTVMMRWREDLSSFTASSWGMLRKLLPLTSRIWSPTCGVGVE